MNLKLILGSITFAMLTGCTNIYFDNGVPEKVNNQSHNSSQWHHNFALALYEGSDAVDLSEHCPQGQWQTVHTYKSFSNGVAEVVVNQIGPAWYPKTVEVSCTKVPFKAE
ncbi:hypothetical protein ATS72_012525 [Pseudoalteromonas sp. 13-15]|jgi:hypothetical protein|uniref:Lipoprotein n=1 Tax=Pseudoalteromonas marina TaxID=267375 RepID=A0ABT9FFL4_9GAMM|nr:MULTISPECIES: hypothetical protein [Pseudoalteromonas]MBL1385979.1 hypothetical protein [Colwellia sp.]AUL74365.1 hypothetical protein ATS72_012525 [Pseudoalteromonas sp. 13-15]KAF7774844.1 hypothetical protein PMAN_a3434 [Pseudoalteromonas marina]MDA8939440.1 hypothetical protein [Pseudoalteromonas marina]MDP2486513.1 hypothetical protein [Pseudoalteromonas marina]|tara:strand:+ start:36 stop:365 length:330 start_codon:yes stop_codon:yes gene_type:complete